ncbi:MAG: MerR family transcriptional regulator [Pseudomonadota bacterium]
MKISEASRRTGLSISTIRYYEQSGLCPTISRGRDGQRQFNAHDLDWLLLLCSLRETGMPTAAMQEFARLYRRGNATVPERKAMLIDHQARLKERQSQLDRCRDLLTKKLSRYDEIIGDQI